MLAPGLCPQDVIRTGRSAFGISTEASRISDVTDKKKQITIERRSTLYQVFMNYSFERFVIIKFSLMVEDKIQLVNLPLNYS
jgi:hypothetical protein